MLGKGRHRRRMATPFGEEGRVGDQAVEKGAQLLRTFGIEVAAAGPAPRLQRLRVAEEIGQRAAPAGEDGEAGGESLARRQAVGLEAERGHEQEVEPGIDRAALGLGEPAAQVDRGALGGGERFAHVGGVVRRVAPDLELGGRGGQAGERPGRDVQSLVRQERADEAETERQSRRASPGARRNVDAVGHQMNGHSRRQVALRAERVDDRPRARDQGARRGERPARPRAAETIERAG